ncbi:hypothetical protein GCM10022251_11560 [Phytohabitans flavus]|uniref:DUF4386 domain-containing protein n=1 Tax=Phytohabitans flavus TaxID=1076124 RepID=A0A6F8XJR8_9ACTN|nr:DUF4386 domain-containing protein [Phytohabitans flavus]BCB74038.1 hypothetical protein Pflav_004480 [Phytohabitans flavus]
MQRYARIAGFLYLTIIVTSLLSLLAVESRLVVAGDRAETARRIADSDLLYRAGLVYDLAMFASVVALAWSLFVILRTVHRDLALLALLWRMAEAVVGAVTILFGVLAALLAAEPDADPALVDAMLTARDTGFDVTIVFLCLGTILNCALLYRARLIPRALSGLGVGAFALMLVGAAAGLLLPEHKDALMAAWAPGIVFEVAIGAWLLAKGVRTPRPPATAPAPALAATTR